MSIVRDGTLHEDLVALLASRMRVRSYLELGIAQQETLTKVYRACLQSCRMLAVDTKLPAEQARHIGVKYFEMTTQEFLKTEASIHAPFQMVFIDADHSEDAVREDFAAVWNHVEDQGLILLHDSYPATDEETDPGICGKVWLAVERLAMIRHDPYDMVTLPFHPGLTIVRKRDKHLPWL